MTIADGATLAPGDLGDTPGTLTIAGDLSLGAGSLLAYSFGQANVPGGPLNDLTVVGGDLTLDGTLDVTTTPGGSFDPGVYRVFNYGGTLTDNGLAIGTIPAPDFFVQTSVASQVNLVNTTGLTLNFWDGDAGPKNDGVVNGGDGTWQSLGRQRQLDRGQRAGERALHRRRLRHLHRRARHGHGRRQPRRGDRLGACSSPSTATVVEGDPITLAGAPGSFVRVGDGTAAGAGMTATIAAELTGASRARQDRPRHPRARGGEQLHRRHRDQSAACSRSPRTRASAPPAGAELRHRHAPDHRELHHRPGGDAAGGRRHHRDRRRHADADRQHRRAGRADQDRPGTLVLDGTNGYSRRHGHRRRHRRGRRGRQPRRGGGAARLRRRHARAPTASFAMDRDTTLDAGGGTIATGAGITLVPGRRHAGAGALTKTGDGTLILTGTGSHAGGTTIAAGTLQLGDGGTSGSLARRHRERRHSRPRPLGRLQPSPGSISGTGLVRQVGDGTTTLGGTNSYAGGTEILGGAHLGRGGRQPRGRGRGRSPSTAGRCRRRPPSRRRARPRSGPAAAPSRRRPAPSPTAGWSPAPARSPRPARARSSCSGANSYAGATTVAAGTLIVNGDQTAATGATTALAGSTLGGTGTIGGDVDRSPTARRSRPATSAPCRHAQHRRRASRSARARCLDYSFGQANVVGGTLNDLTEVAGDLTLDGTLNVTTTPGGSFDPGVYRVISYGGALTDNGLAIGTIPSPDFFVQTSIANQVNLVNTAGLTLNFWDGDAGPKNDGVVNGGDGTWQSSAGNDNWTEATGSVNAPLPTAPSPSSPARPARSPSTTASARSPPPGMQFAVDGYLVEGDPITLVGAPRSIVASATAPPPAPASPPRSRAELTGGVRLRKTDLGTLVALRRAANSYTGGTAIDGGTSRSPTTPASGALAAI